MEPRGEVETRANDPAVLAVRAAPPGQRLERFFKAPVWEVTAHGSPVRVTARDLRFSSLVLARDPVFVFSFEVQPDGVVREDLHSSDFAGGR